MALRAQLADWLSQYANAGTRRTYAYALGLPVAWVDPTAGHRRGRPPRPPPPPGPLHHLAWFRWCAARDLDPRAATATHVKAWLHALDAAGAQPRTRRRMLSTLSALYGHLAETGVIAANPAALQPGPPRPGRSARDASPTVRLTAAPGRRAARRRPPGPPSAAAYAPPLRHPRRRVRRPAHPRPADLRDHRAGPRRPLPHRRRRRAARARQGRATPRGVRHRPRPRRPSAEYLAERDRLAGTAAPARRGRTAAGASPAPRHPRGRRAARGSTSTRSCAASPRTPGPSSTASRTGCTRTPCATPT